MTDKRRTLGQIAQLLGAKLVVNCRASSTQSVSELKVSGVGTLASAQVGEIAFLSNQRYKKYLASTQALAVILEEIACEDCAAHCLVHPNPYQAYAKLTQLYDCRPLSDLGVHQDALVSSSAVIGSGARIGPGVIIGDDVVLGKDADIGANVVIEQGVTIGSQASLRANVTLCYGVSLGDNVSVQSGAVIGSDGFGYAPEINRESGAMNWHKIAQLGSVRIGSNVEIGANTTIDRGALEDTIIQDNVIIDNQVQIAHNVQIGEGTAIAGCVGIAGSAKIGRNCSVGGGAGIAGHLSIADGTTVLGMTLINRSVNQPGMYASGTGMQEAGSWRKSAVRFTQLEELNRRVKQLEQQLSEKQLSEQAATQRSQKNSDPDN